MVDASRRVRTADQWFIVVSGWPFHGERFFRTLLFQLVGVVAEVVLLILILALLLADLVVEGLRESLVVGLVQHVERQVLTTQPQQAERCIEISDVLRV